MADAAPRFDVNLTARQAEVPLPMTGLTAQLIAAARAQGYGALDHFRAAQRD
jgi:3-hydroxyisobutyrate dehydrogenase-like beta-hydroxyacid dehydrogenase